MIFWMQGFDFLAVAYGVPEPETFPPAFADYPSSSKRRRIANCALQCHPGRTIKTRDQHSPVHQSSELRLIGMRTLVMVIRSQGLASTHGLL